MNKIYKIVDGQYFDGDYYEVVDVADGKKQITFSPSTVVQEGTEMDAEKFNVFQKNGTYYTDTSHAIDGGKSIYTILDFEDVGNFGVFVGFKLLINPTVSSVGGSKVEFLSVRYDIKKSNGTSLIDIEADEIFKNTPALLVYNGSEFVLQNVQVIKAIENLETSKEDAFSKNSGFNKNKSDSVTSSSSDIIATSKAVKTAYDKAYGKNEWTTNKATNGYQKLPSGVIIQWGFADCPQSSSDTTITFPISFPTACRAVTIGNESTESVRGDKVMWKVVKSLTQSSFKVRNGSDYNIDVYWIAIGY